MVARMLEDRILERPVRLDWIRHRPIEETQACFVSVLIALTTLVAIEGGEIGHSYIELEDS